MNEDVLRQLTSRDDIKNELVKQFTKHIESEELDTDDSLVKAKLVVLGPLNAGKTSWVTRLIQSKFSEAQQPTIGAKFFSQGVLVEPNEYNFEIWDVSGDEWYKSLVPMYLQYAHAVVICYDSTSHDSLEKGKEWLKYVKSIGDKEILIAFVGMKSDLVSTLNYDEKSNKELTAEAQSYFVTECQLDPEFFFPAVSAKTGDGVQDVILSIAEKLHEKGVRQPRTSIMDPNIAYDGFAKKVIAADKQNKIKNLSGGGGGESWYTKYLGISEESVERFGNNMSSCLESTKEMFGVCFESSKKVTKKTLDSTKKNVKEFSKTMDRKSRKFGNEVKVRTAQLINNFRGNENSNQAVGNHDDIRDTWDDSEKNLQMKKPKIMKLKD